MRLLPSILIITAIAIALWQWSLLPRPRSRFFAALGLLIAAAFVMEVYGAITNYYLVANNIPYNLFGQVEAMLVLYLIGTLRPAWRPWLIASGVLFIAAFIGNAIYRETLDVLMSESILLIALVLSMVLMSALWWLAQTSTEPLQNVLAFWILIGLLIYFAGIVPTIGGYEFIFKEYETGHRVFHIVQGLCVIRYLLTAYGCHLARRSSRGVDASA